MSSVTGFNPHLSAYQALATRIDNDQPRHNPLDHTAGDDAEVFAPNTQSWQSRQRGMADLPHSAVLTARR